MPNQSVQLNSVFQALADPTRRAVLERLSVGPAPMSALAQPFNMALPSFLQHMKMLEGCGLVRSRKTGRVRTYELAPESMQAAEDWMANQRSMWNKRLDQLEAYLKDMESE